MSVDVNVYDLPVTHRVIWAHTLNDQAKLIASGEGSIERGFIKGGRICKKIIALDNAPDGAQSIVICKIGIFHYRDRLQETAQELFAAFDKAGLPKPKLTNQNEVCARAYRGMYALRRRIARCIAPEAIRNKIA